MYPKRRKINNNKIVHSVNMKLQALKDENDEHDTASTGKLKCSIGDWSDRKMSIKTCSMSKWHLNVVATGPGGVLAMCELNRTVIN